MAKKGDMREGRGNILLPSLFSAVQIRSGEPALGDSRQFLTRPFVKKFSSIQALPPPAPMAVPIAAIAINKPAMESSITNNIRSLM
jgi:hypothetical protein